MILPRSGPRGGAHVEHIDRFMIHQRRKGIGFFITFAEGEVGHHSVYLSSTTLFDIIAVPDDVRRRLESAPSTGEFVRDGFVRFKTQKATSSVNSDLARHIGEKFFNFAQLELLLSADECKKVYDEAWKLLQRYGPILCDNDVSRLTGKQMEELHTQWKADYRAKNRVSWKRSHVTAHKDKWRKAYVDANKKDWHDQFVISEMESLQEWRQQKKQKAAEEQPAQE